MAMSMPGGAGKGRRRGRRNRRRGGAISDINVTPLVDVMLVLLIVFMVAAPLLTVGVPIDLPQTRARAMQPVSKPITVSVSPAGDVFVDEDPVTLDTLLDTVGGRAVSGTDERIYVRGDASADYGTVMRVMGALSGAGYERIGLITAQEQGQ